MRRNRLDLAVAIPWRTVAFTRQAILAAADGLIVLLGTASDVGVAMGADDSESAHRRLSDWKHAFGDRAYLEVARTGREGEDRLVAGAVDLAAASEVPVVACNEVRFLAPDDFEAHETRVCIQEGRVLNDPRRERRHSVEQYLRTPAEMHELFADLPEALANTVEIAKRCSLELLLGEPCLPEPPIDKDTTSESLLATRAREGLERHLESLVESSAEVDRNRYEERLDYELDIITKMGFAGYFLIVEEFVTWARANAVPVGCRGSGTASLVAFCLGITELDPLKYDLLFERLLNPERVSLPDFDIDVCMERRGEALAHVADLYGHDAVSQIATFGTMAARAVVRDVARVQDKPFGLADRLSKMIPAEVGMTLSKAVDQEQELADFIARNEDAQEIMDMAYKLEGTVRNVGKHAGGVVISPTTLTDFVPLYTDHSGGTVVSQYDLYDVEEAGLVKFDFLGLRTLTIIDWAVSAINAEREGRGDDAIDLDDVPLDDAETYEFMKTAHTTAVFQLESTGMKELVARLKPDSIDDIIALVALFRPGPLQSGAVDDYVERKHGRQPVRYAHPRLEGALSSTYGVMLYQEQVMTMAQLLAGFTLGEADLLRRAMAKKKPEEMAKMRATFLDGTTKEGVDARIANDIFDQVEKFAGYAFNKAHAAGYALLAFRTAYLKAHYPAHFMSAVLSADMDKIEKVVPLVGRSPPHGPRCIAARCQSQQLPVPSGRGRDPLRAGARCAASVPAPWKHSCWNAVATVHSGIWTTSVCASIHVASTSAWSKPSSGRVPWIVSPRRTSSSTRRERGFSMSCPTRCKAQNNRHGTRNWPSTTCSAASRSRRRSPMAARSGPFPSTTAWKANGRPSDYF